MVVLVTSVFLLLSFVAPVVSLKLSVASGGGNASSPLLYGLLYEDVYHSGDGGLYAELIQNRAFQGSTVNGQASRDRTLQYWHNRENSNLELDNSAPLLSDALPYHMRVDVTAGATGLGGFWNEGWTGINITTATRYAASFYLRGTYTGQIDCTFWSNTTNGQLGHTSFTVSQTDSDGWVHYAQTFTTTTSAPDWKNTFHLTFDAGSTAGRSLHFHMISAFQQTYKNANNGMRMDLTEAVNSIGAKYLRFPGGNNMEGAGSLDRFIWNNTIGPIINRPGYRGTWGYFVTDGFGLLEQMQWTIDMGLEPILAVWAGYYIDGEHVLQGDLQPYVDEVMNELAFLMDPTSTQLGALRASLGYSTPFSVKYVEIGNEDYFDGSGSYTGYRFNMYYNAIKAKYPSMKIISTMDVDSFANPLPDVIYDNHHYFSSADTLGLFNRYDNRPRSQPLLIGEYATIYDSTHGNIQIEEASLESATAEAVMWLGFERNSDVIVGCSHGALIKSLRDNSSISDENVAVFKHSANQIVYSMSYYVSRMFAQNHGSETVPTTSDSGYGPLYWSSTKSASGTYFIKVVNFNGSASTPVTVTIAGNTQTSAKLITFTAPDKGSTNTLGNDQSIIGEITISAANGIFQFTLSGSFITSVLVV